MKPFSLLTRTTMVAVFFPGVANVSRPGDGDLLPSYRLLHARPCDPNFATRWRPTVLTIPVPAQPHAGSELGLVLQNVAMVARQNKGSSRFRCEL